MSEKCFIGNIYENRKNKERHVKVVNTINEDIVLIKFTDGKSIGETKEIKISNLKKSWKLICSADKTTIENVQENPQLSVDDSNNASIDDNLQLISTTILNNGYDIKTYSGRLNNLIIKFNNKVIAEVCVKRKKCVIYTKDKISVDSYKINNGKFRLDLSYFGGIENTIIELIGGCRE